MRRRHQPSAFELPCKRVCLCVCLFMLWWLFAFRKEYVCMLSCKSKVFGPYMCTCVFLCKCVCVCVLFPESCRAYDNWWWLIQTFAYFVCRRRRQKWRKRRRRETERDRSWWCIWEVVLGFGVRRCVVCVCVCVCLCLFAYPWEADTSHWPLRAATCECMRRNQCWLDTLIKTKHLSVKILFILREAKIGHWRRNCWESVNEALWQDYCIPRNSSDFFNTHRWC